MVPAMARQFMSVRNDAPDQRREPLRYPAKDKERRLPIRHFELIENAISVVIDPRGKGIPIRPVNTVGKRLDLEIVLHVDGHRVANRSHYGRPAAALVSSRSNTRPNTCSWRNDRCSSCSMRRSRSSRSLSEAAGGGPA